jgi:hypothetical protein
MSMDGKVSNYWLILQFIMLITVSDRRHAKAVNPLDETRKRGLNDDAIEAAIREFEARNGNLSEDEE